jgi:thymidylate kinase
MEAPVSHTESRARLSVARSKRMIAGNQVRRPRLVSFSGIDGSGKSTQIENLCARLKEAGLRVALITFWDDVARLTFIREATGHALFRGDNGVGTPAMPINRRDKNVQSRFMTAVRVCLYLVDTLSLRLVIRKMAKSEVDFVVFDRYIYDELANLSLRNPVLRLYARFILKLTPKPDISYLLDADPDEARARKPEYPIEFLRQNRASYLALNDAVGAMTIIAPMPAMDVQRQVWTHLSRNEVKGPARSEEQETFPTAP